MKQRVTITLDEDVLDRYKEMAHVSRSTFSKCINDWLAGTADAAEHLTKTIATAKQSPQRAMADLSLFQEEMQHQLDGLNEDIRGLLGDTDVRTPAAQREDVRAAGPSGKTVSSPHSNTGLKPPPYPTKG